MKRFRSIYQEITRLKKTDMIGVDNKKQIFSQLNGKDSSITICVKRDAHKWKTDRAATSDYINSKIADKENLEYDRYIFIKDYCMTYQKPLKGTNYIMAYDILDDTICFYTADSVIHNPVIRPVLKVYNQELKDFEKALIIADGTTYYVVQYENRFRSIRGESIEYAVNKIKGMIRLKHPEITDDKMDIGTIIGKDIIQIIKRIKYLDHSTHYNHLKKMCKNNDWKPINAGKVREQYIDMVDRWISKNEEAILNTMESDISVSDIVRYSSFSKYRGDNIEGEEGRPISNVYVTIRLDDYYDTPKKITAILNSRQDDLLRYSRNLLYTDKEIFDMRKSIVLRNIIIGNDNSIEFMYNNIDMEGENDGYEGEERAFE